MLSILEFGPHQGAYVNNVCFRGTLGHAIQVGPLRGLETEGLRPDNIGPFEWPVCEEALLGCVP